MDQTNKTLCHIVLWIAQGLLAAIFMMEGIPKVTLPIEVLAKSIPWAVDLPLNLLKLIGIFEILGGLGLILPSLLRIKPYITVWAAIGLIIIMVLAMIFHISRGEFPSIGINILLMSIATFIAWGRVKLAPIRSRH